MKIFVVIPLYNEEKHIEGLLKALQKYKLPVIVVDDGSTDNSVSKVKKFKDVTLLEHKINLGKGSSMKTGAEFAFSRGADAVIFMDADAQHEPEDLPKFIKALKEKKCDLVLGSRNLNMGVPLIRYLGNKFASILIRFLFGIYVSDLICGYKGMTKKVYEAVKWDSTGYGVETEIVVKASKAKIKLCEVSVETIYHDTVKGVTILDAFTILGDVIRWKISK